MRVEHIGDAILYLGDCLEILPTLDGIEAVITDPPYSSGGQFRGDRAQKTAYKYVQSGGTGFSLDFSGDNKDQRAFFAWASLWFGYLHAAAKTGAVLLSFTDWRQLPIMTDAIQAGGWIWRNIVTWWKPGIRMQRGRFSSSAEYLVYASRGVPTSGETSPQNVLSFAPVSGNAKEHIAEKPILLLDTLVRVTVPGATVIDPFMGVATTGVACARLGRAFIGIELNEGIFDTACRRIEDAYKQPRLFEDQAEPKPEQQALFVDSVS